MSNLASEQRIRNSEGIQHLQKLVIIVNPKEGNIWEPYKGSSVLRILNPMDAHGRQVAKMFTITPSLYLCTFQHDSVAPSIKR